MDGQRESNNREGWNLIDEIAYCLSENLKSNRIPCHLETPHGEWAAIHIDILCGWSLTVCVTEDRIIFSVHTHSIGGRRMRSDDPHLGRIRNWQILLTNPKAVDEVIRWCKMEISGQIIITGWLDYEARLKILNNPSYVQIGPFNLGRPYYLV